VLFSSRWGRMANPGVSLVVAGLPGLAAGVALDQVIRNGMAGGKGGPVPVEVVEAIRAAGAMLYPKVAMLGVALLVAAGVGRIVTAVAKAVRGKTKPVVD